MTNYWLALPHRGYGIPFSAADDAQARTNTKQLLKQHRVRTRYLLWRQDDNPIAASKNCTTWQTVPKEPQQ